MGNHNANSDSAWPRSHHKFVLFCELEHDDDSAPVVRPTSVWTGSYNFTVNASRSLDNAVVAAYFAEWAQVTALSEPLDWTTAWSSPTWRIGS